MRCEAILENDDAAGVAVTELHFVNIASGTTVATIVQGGSGSLLPPTYLSVDLPATTFASTVPGTPDVFELQLLTTNASHAATCYSAGVALVWL